MSNLKGVSCEIFAPHTKACGMSFFFDEALWVVLLNGLGETDRQTERQHTMVIQLSTLVICMHLLPLPHVQTSSWADVICKLARPVPR